MFWLIGYLLLGLITFFVVTYADGRSGARAPDPVDFILLVTMVWWVVCIGEIGGWLISRVEPGLVQLAYRLGRKHAGLSD
jgi:hypothetical protein